MRIYYGVTNNNMEVTDRCMKQIKNNIIIIPSGDANRANLFTDPLVGIHKYIIIEHDGIITKYNEYVQIRINTITNQIETVNNSDINNKLLNIHSKLKINHGNFNEELPEQKMVAKYNSLISEHSVPF